MKNVLNFLSKSVDCEFRNDIEEVFHGDHPRYKALERMSGEILDIGAGDGGMGQLLYWPKPQIGKRLVGCDLDKRDHLPKGYLDWISGGWEHITTSKKFGGIFAIHVIEHLDSWRLMLERAIEVLDEGEFIYIEWPVMESTSWPSANEIWMNFTFEHESYTRQLLSTFNFYDDDTHTESPPSMKNVLDCLSKLNILENDRIYLPGSAKGLVSKGLNEHSVSNVTMGVWAEFGFAQYVLAQKKS